METTAIGMGLGMGLLMMAVAVAVGALVLEATFSMLCRALSVPAIAAPFEPAAIHLSEVERAADVLYVARNPSGKS